MAGKAALAWAGRGRCASELSAEQEPSLWERGTGGRQEFG